MLVPLVTVRWRYVFRCCRLLAENLNACLRNKQEVMGRLRDLQEEKRGGEDVKVALRRKLADLADKKRRLNQQLDELKLSDTPEANSVQNLVSI